MIGAKVINLTLTITNKGCNEDDQSFWRSLKEAVTDNTFFKTVFIYLVRSLFVQVIPVFVQSTLLLHDTEVAYESWSSLSMLKLN